nr:cytochrome P450 monooxygenase CYP347AE1 [Lasioderma serricorne]
MLIAVIFVVTLTVYFLQKCWILCTFDFWKKRNVNGPKPLPFFGNILDMILVKKSTGQIYTEIYNKRQFVHLPWVGVYNLNNPELLIRDPELIREILLKDFTSFEDNGTQVSEKSDPLLCRNPFFLRGQEWKDTRTQLVPSFTTTRVKEVVQKIQFVARKFVAFIDENIKEQFELKGLSLRFTTDNAFSLLYSLDSKSFDDKAAENWKIIRNAFTPSFSLAVRSSAVTIMPWLHYFLKIGLFPTELNDLISKLTRKSLNNSRKETKDDLVDIYAHLLNRKTGQTFSENEVASHCGGFILDGVETTATALSYALYELAENPETQDKLYAEIKSVVDTYGNIYQINYEVIQEMTYLDCVCSEALRMHPPLLIMNKVCTNPYTLISPKDENVAVNLDKGVQVILPYLALHYDPKYFPKPEIFDPDRFSPENRSNIIKGTYLPFGDGPRKCLGQKFGLLQMKLGIMNVVSNFKMEVGEKTKRPLEIDPSFFLMATKGGIWVRFKKRNLV